MILTEQILKRLSRNFWHGSQYESWDKEKSKYKTFYVTTSAIYALKYSKEDNEEIDKCRYLTKYNLKKQVNFFNARSKKDIIILENFCRTHNLYLFLKNIYLLQNEDWLNVFSKEEKSNL